MGWFWGPERDFALAHDGIVETVVGYSGSKDDTAVNPTYQNILDCKYENILLFV